MQVPAAHWGRYHRRGRVSGSRGGGGRGMNDRASAKISILSPLYDGAKKMFHTVSAETKIKAALAVREIREVPSLRSTKTSVKNVKIKPIGP